MSVVLNEILGKLTSFIKKYYVNELIKGSLLFLSIGLLYFLVILVLENLLWLSPFGRRILFWTFVVIEVLLFIKFIGFPLLKLSKLSKRISNEEASKIIGNHFTDVDDQLLNLLQLNNLNDSSELLQASIEQKSKQLSPIPFNLAVNFKKSFSYAKYALIPLMVFILFSLFNGTDWYQKSFTRVVNYNTAYEAPAPFYFKVLNEKLEVIQQEDYNLIVTTYGNIIPNQVAVEYNNETYFLKKDGYNKFSYTFKNLQEDIDFNLSSGEEHSKSYNLLVNAAPSINDFQMQVTPPNHTKQNQKVYSNTGNAVIPEGSKINWLITSENATTINFIIDTTSVEFDNIANKFNYSKRISDATEYQITTSNKFAKNYEKLFFSLDVVKDKKPSISVQSAKDTTQINKQLFYGQITDDYGLRKLDVVYFKADNDQDIKRIPINIQSGIFSDFTYQFPNGIPLEEATSYAFYFEVFDNDSYRGSKSTKSETFNYRELSNVETQQSESKNDQQQLDQFSKTLDEFQKSEMDLETFSKLQKQQSTLSFKEKQKLDDVLDKQSKQQESLKKLSDKLDKTLSKLKEDENSEAIKEQLERTNKELEKNKKLIDEIKKALEKLSAKELQEKVDELKKDNKKLTKNLNQVLELIKRDYVIDKHQSVVQMLELLSKKQLSLAEDSSNVVEEKQKQINKEWKIVQDELNDLRKHNSALRKPMNLDDDPAYEEKINSELKNALNELSKDNLKDAKKKQKLSGIMLQNLADKMQTEGTPGGGSGGDESEEDLEMLRQILDNLVLYSLNQESNMDSFKGINSNNSSYSSYVRRQHVLREHFNHIDDSLYALASRNPKIGNEVNDLISDIDYDLESSITKFTDNKTNSGIINLQYAVSHANDLALMLSKSLNQLNEQSKPGKKGDKQNKKKGFQLPDIIKKQESLNKAMQQMLESGEKKPGDSKKEEAGGEKKPGNKGESGEKGKDGENGDQGENGKDGKSGEQGESGENGMQGKNGQGEGKDGQGKTPGESQGKDGQNGKDTMSGKGNNPGNDGESSDESKGENSNKGKNGNEGKEGNGKDKGQSNGKGDGESSEEESDYGQLFEIYKQQQDLRNQLAERLQQEGINPIEKRILNQMEQVENELLERGFNDETMKRMVDLKHQLFKLDKAQFQQGEDSKRKGDTYKKEIESYQLITPTQIKQYFNTTEILNRQMLPLQPEFKRKVQEYFISHD